MSEVTVLGIFVADISFSAMFRERMKKMPEDRRQQRFDNIGDPKRYDRGKSTFEIGVESPFVKYSVYAFEAAFQNIEAKLNDGRKWLIKEHYSLADLGLTPYLARLEYLDLLDVWTQDKLNTNNWWQRIKQRPSYAKAISDPLTEVEIANMKNSGSKIKGKIKDIINPYFTTKKNGSGLGLSIVNKIINDHDGELKFYNVSDGAKIEVNFINLDSIYINKDEISTARKRKLESDQGRFVQGIKKAFAICNPIVGFSCSRRILYSYHFSP